MTQAKAEEQMCAYTEAVQSGLYAKQSGLVGKYDNVRRYWEDEITRFHLRPHLQRLIERNEERMRRLRILDLGCGAADGYELLAGIRQRDASLEQSEVRLLSEEALGLYKGIDLNEDLLEQARGIYGRHPKMVFQQGDFSHGLPLGAGEKPYDLYFSSFGTFSHHNKDETAVELLAEVATSVRDYAVVVCDWVGRYSYEWQSLWTREREELLNMDYVVSYIYSPEEREAKRDQLQHLTLRLMSRQEAENIIGQASKKAGVEIRPLTWFDRSTFCGRHMDTGDYNAYAQPMRTAINCLHEANVRTNLQDLILNYVPKDGFDFVNDYFEHTALCWNAIVHYVDRCMHIYDETNRCFREEPPAIPVSCPAVLREMMLRMRQVIEGIGWLSYGLPRENIIEPQLGYALRYLVTSLQKGQGCAHGLVGIFEVKKNG